MIVKRPNIAPPPPPPPPLSLSLYIYIYLLILFTFLQYKDDHSLYLVMDFHPGGDLFTIMERREGGMSEQEARFYVAEIS